VDISIVSQTPDFHIRNSGQLST